MRAALCHGEWTARLLLLLLVPMLCFGLLEGAMWLAGVSPLASEPAYSERAKHRACQFGWRDASRRCAPDRIREKDRRLVVTLGGSSVAGYPRGRTVSLARPLQALLERAESERWRVVNRAFVCKDSIFVRDCAAEVLEGGAQVLVVYSGHNDFANWWPWSTRRRIWLEEHAWIYEVEVRLARTRAFSSLVRALASLGEPGRALRLPTPPQAERSSEIVVDQFAADIVAVIERARKHGAEVLLVTVVSNLYEFPVRREDWDTEPALQARRNPALADWAARYARGVALHRQGRSAEALAAFEQARDLNPQGRARSVLNERIRTLAAAHENAHLVDFERELRRIGAVEGIGCNFFGDEEYCDQFHPNVRTVRMLARAVLGRMVQLGLVPPDDGP